MTVQIALVGMIVDSITNGCVVYFCFFLSGYLDVCWTLCDVRWEIFLSIPRESKDRELRSFVLFGMFFLFTLCVFLIWDLF